MTTKFALLKRVTKSPKYKLIQMLVEVVHNFKKVVRRVQARPPNVQGQLPIYETISIQNSKMRLM
ncbi:hypothetical protein PanWU01x14_155110, partial [Parasponia andersonii]